MRKQTLAKLAAVPAFTLATAGYALAALPAGVTTAIETAGTDMTTAVTAIIAAFVVFWGLKKLAGKFGWI